jgi:hypothetical protein
LGRKKNVFGGKSFGGGEAKVLGAHLSTRTLGTVAFAPTDGDSKKIGKLFLLPNFLNSNF